MSGRNPLLAKLAADSPEQVIQIIVVRHTRLTSIIEMTTEKMEEILGLHGINKGHPPRPE